MRVTVTPGIPQGTVRVPTSKSVAHRYLIAAAFTPGSGTDEFTERLRQRQADALARSL